MTLEDYCNSKEKGSRFVYSVIFPDDEDLFLEVGERVANYAAESGYEGWDALMDLHYDEYCRGIDD